MIGNHELHLTATMTDYPAIVTTDVIILPISFSRCPVEVEIAWNISDVSVPSLETMSHYF